VPGARAECRARAGPRGPCPARARGPVPSAVPRAGPVPVLESEYASMKHQHSTA